MSYKDAKAILYHSNVELTTDQEILRCGFEALVELFKPEKIYTGDLNDFRISPSDLRNLAISYMQDGIVEIGVEDFLRALKTMAVKS